MSEFAMMIDGALAFARPKPVTVDGVQHPRGIFGLWSDADLASLGVWRVDREPVPAGMMATGWTLAVDGDRVTATPDVQPIPAQPVTVTVEQLAAILAPPADDGGGLVVGRWYEAGATVTVGDAVYQVTRPFLYSNSEWTPSALAAHLSLVVSAGDPWAQPAGAHDAYAEGVEVTHNGRLWRNDNDNNVFEPGVWGWTDLGPA